MGIIKNIKIKKVLKQHPVIIAKNYKNYSDYIKNNPEVIKKALRYIEIDFDVLYKILEKYPESINDVCVGININKENYIKLFTGIKGLINYLNEYNLFSLIYDFDFDISEAHYKKLTQEQKIELINKIADYYFKYDNHDIFINQLDFNTQKKIFDMDKTLFKDLSHDVKIKIIELYPNYLPLLNAQSQLAVLKQNPNMVIYCDNINILRMFLDYNDLSRLDYETVIYLYNKGISPFLIKKLVKLDNKINNLLIKYSKKNYIDYYIKNLLLDKKILNCNSIESIDDYLKNPTTAKFSKILMNAYGEHVNDIIIKRPNLSLEHIENYEIFNKEIYEVLGINFIEQMLNYSFNNSNFLFSIITKDMNMLNNYAFLYKYMNNEIGQCVETMDLSIQSFITLSPLLKNSSIESLIKKYPKQMNIILFSTLCKEDLLKLSSEIDLLYMNIAKFYFDEDFLISIPFINVRDIDSKGILSDAELEIIQAMSLMMNGKENSFRDEFEDIIMDNYDKFNPLTIRKIINKINEIYTEDFVSNITNEAKIKDDNNNISSYIINNGNVVQVSANNPDGVSVVDFKGQDFLFLVSGVTGMSQSVQYDAYAQNLSPNQLVNRWLTMENGVSTISTSLLCESIIFSEGSEFYTNFFGFNEFENSQIYRFFSTDAGAKHSPKSIYQSSFAHFGVTYKECINAILKRQERRPLNETTIKRYNSKGERILPNFILVYSNNPKQLKYAIEVVKEFEKIGHKIKIYRIFPEYYKGRTNLYCDNRVLDIPKPIDSLLIREIKERMEQKHRSM